MYSVQAYGEMIRDAVRMDAYSRALERAIEPGATVVDIGTGTGIFAMLACRFGAGHVLAIEPNDAISVAREIAKTNGFADRITFVQELSTKVSLPRRADVMISDLRGALPLFSGHIPAIIDARERHLAPRGTLIPQRDTLWIGLVSAANIYRRYTEPWTDNKYGLDMSAGQKIVTNTWETHSEVKPEDLLCAPQPCMILDYTTINSPNVDGAVTWRVDRNAVGHGLCIWFDTVLAEDIRFSTAPGEHKSVYGNAFFPWSQTVDLQTGDIVSVHLRANMVGDEYIWQWRTRVTANGNPSQVKADFHQSTFHGVPLTSAQLRKRSPGHVPQLDEEGEIQKLVLNMMDGATRMEEIASRLAARFPKRFPNEADAIAKVGEFSVKYSR